MKNETEEGSVTNNNEGSFNGTNIEDGNKKSDLGIKKEKKQMDKNMNKHGRLRSVTVSEKKFLDDAVCEAMKVKGKNLTKEERRMLLVNKYVLSVKLIRLKVKELKQDMLQCLNGNALILFVAKKLHPNLFKYYKSTWQFS